MLLLLLVACGDGAKDGSDGNTFDTSGGGCVDPVAHILSPKDGASVTEGELVSFTGEVESLNDDISHVQVVWGVDGDAVGTGLDAAWTAAGVGTHVIQMQATDDCSTSVDDVSVTVVAAE